MSSRNLLDRQRVRRVLSQGLAVSPVMERMEERVLMSATSFAFDPDGSGPLAPIPDVAILDWGPDSTLSVGIKQAVDNFIANGNTSNGPRPTTYTTYVHSRLSVIRNQTSNDVTPSEIQSNVFEYTLVAGYQQQITAVIGPYGSLGSSIQSVHTGSTAAGVPNFVEVYFDASPNSNPLAGTGYNDGLLVMSGTVNGGVGSTHFITGPSPFGPNFLPLDGFGADNYPAIDSVRALGSSQTNITVTQQNDDFVVDKLLVMSIVNAAINLNFTQVDPSAAFVFSAGGSANGQIGNVNGPITAGAGIGTASLGTVNAVNGPDVQFQNDSTQSFIVEDRPAELGDYVWHDKNMDGQQDGNEPGIQGVKVELYNCDGNVLVGTQFTDANGKYLFTNLAPGTYHVKFYTPTGYVLTTQDVGADASDSDANAITGQTICTTLVAGESDLTWDAGMYKLAEIGDYVWHDKDVDGQQDGNEPGIVGVKVELYNCANPNVVLATQFTDANGKYLFTGLQPGTYHVKFYTPAGFVFTTQDIGADATDSDANVVSGQTICTTLDEGESDLTWDAGMYRPAEIGDYVWHDKDADGQQDGDETGIGNVKVELYNCDGNVLVGTQFTDANGKYLFTGLKPGTYHVKFYTPAGYVITTQDVGSDASDSDANVVSGQTICTTLDEGESDLTWDAGVYRPAEIGDYVWEDKDRDGQQEGGEPGIGNVKVELYNCDGNVLVGTQFTDANGKYLFTGLKPGTYHIKFYTPTGYIMTTQDVGADGSDSDANVVSGQTICTTLEDGESDKTWDAGMYRPAEIGNYVWEDLDKDGLQDGNEPGVPGVTVRLYDCVTNALVGTTLTNASGLYIFTGLVPGSYHIEFVKPAGYDITTKDVGGNDGIDSDADLVTGKTICTTLESGESDMTWDMGLVKIVVQNPDIDIEKYIKVVQEPGGSGEGLTPGYWKQPHHFDDWTTYSPTDNYNAVFGVNDDPSLTLLGALQRGGGGKKALGRHAVAALLNASHPNIEYNLTVAQIIASVQNAYATNNFTPLKDQLDAYNNQGADLHSSGGSGGGSGGGGYGADADTHDQALVVTVGDTVMFTYVVTNTGNVPLSNVVVKDDNATPGLLGDDFNPTPVLAGAYNVGDEDQDNILDLDEEWLYTAMTVVVAGEYCNLGTVTGKNVSNPAQTVTDTDPACWETQLGDPEIDIEKYVKPVAVPTGGGEGLTPGFWKTHSEYGPAPLKGWPETGYDPDQSYEAIFGVNVPGNPTLLDALNANGGGINALMRHSTAALLNAANPNISYLYTKAQVISMTKTAIASGAAAIEATKNLFAKQNELGADLSTPANGGGDMSGPGSDADVPTGPIVLVGTKVMFTYEVKNTGDVPLANVTVVDDNDTPANTADDFNPTYVGGDSNNNGLLDLNETWTYTAMTEVTAGQHKNIAVARGTADGETVTDEDPAHWYGQALDQEDLSSLSGFVYKDLDDDGQIDVNESGIAGVTIKLTGTNDLGQNVSKSTVTDGAGFYLFDDLRAGTYKITETQPAGYIDGKDTIGTPGGTTSNDMFSNIVLAASVNGINNNFGERMTTTNTVVLAKGMTATIGFWHNKNGQALLTSLNGSANATNLGNWLATNFPKLYGAQAGVNNLAGKTNAYIAELFKTVLFNTTGQKLDAQVLATAFAVYVTNSSLAGTVASSYGFTVNSKGTGVATINVGTNGAAFGVANYTKLTVMQCLQAANAQAVNGVLYGGNTTLRTKANEVFDGINNGGDIG